MSVIKPWGPANYLQHLCLGGCPSRVWCRPTGKGPVSWNPQREEKWLSSAHLPKPGLPGLPQWSLLGCPALLPPLGLSLAARPQVSILVSNLRAAGPPACPACPAFLVPSVAAVEAVEGAARLCPLSHPCFPSCGLFLFCGPAPSLPSPGQGLLPLSPAAASPGSILGGHAWAASAPRPGPGRPAQLPEQDAW